MGSSPNIKDTIDYGQLESTYKGWISDAEKARTKGFSSETARLAASGIKPGSTSWEKALEEVNKSYKTRMDEIYSSSTYNLVKKNKRMEKWRDAMTEKRVKTQVEERAAGRYFVGRDEGVQAQKSFAEGMGANFAINR